MIIIRDGKPQLQCKDIPDDLYLEAVRRAQELLKRPYPNPWVMWWDLQAELETLMSVKLPYLLVTAKGHVLRRRGLLDTCCRECRGDVHFPQPDASCC